jgi:hypothetical protein
MTGVHTMARKERKARRAANQASRPFRCALLVAGSAMSAACMGNAGDASQLVGTTSSGLTEDDPCGVGMLDTCVPASGESEYQGRAAATTSIHYKLLAPVRMHAKNFGLTPCVNVYLPDGKLATNAQYQAVDAISTRVDVYTYESSTQRSSADLLDMSAQASVDAPFVSASFEAKFSASSSSEFKQRSYGLTMYGIVSALTRVAYENNVVVRLVPDRQTGLIQAVGDLAGDNATLGGNSQFSSDNTSVTVDLASPQSATFRSWLNGCGVGYVDKEWGGGRYQIDQFTTTSDAKSSQDIGGKLGLNVGGSYGAIKASGGAAFATQSQAMHSSASATHTFKADMLALSAAFNPDNLLAGLKCTSVEACLASPEASTVLTNLDAELRKGFNPEQSFSQGMATISYLSGADLGSDKFAVGSVLRKRALLLLNSMYTVSNGLRGITAKMKRLQALLDADQKIMADMIALNPKLYAYHRANVSPAPAQWGGTPYNYIDMAPRVMQDLLKADAAASANDTYRKLAMVGGDNAIDPKGLSSPIDVIANQLGSDVTKVSQIYGFWAANMKNLAPLRAQILTDMADLEKEIEACQALTSCPVTASGSSLNFNGTSAYSRAIRHALYFRVNRPRVMNIRLIPLIGTKTFNKVEEAAWSTLYNSGNSSIVLNNSKGAASADKMLDVAGYSSLWYAGGAIAQAGAWMSKGNGDADANAWYKWFAGAANAGALRNRKNYDANTQYQPGDYVSFENASLKGLFACQQAVKGQDPSVANSPWGAIAENRPMGPFKWGDTFGLYVYQKCTNDDDPNNKDLCSNIFSNWVLGSEKPNSVAVLQKGAGAESVNLVTAMIPGERTITNAFGVGLGVFSTEDGAFPLFDDIIPDAWVLDEFNAIYPAQ